MRFSTWSEFTEKVSTFESEVTGKIIKFKEDHSLLDRVIKESLGFLPPPINVVAQNLYGSFNGTEEEKSNSVIKYLKNLEEKGQEYFEKTISKLDTVLTKIDDVKNLNNDQIQLIEKLLKSSEENQNQILDEFKKLDTKIDSVKDDTTQIKEDTDILKKEIISLKNLISNETKSLTSDGISSEITPDNKINLSKEKQLEHNQQLDTIINLIGTYTISSQNIPASIVELLQMSSYYHNTNQPQKSIIFLDKILEKDSRNIIALTDKGICLHMLKKDDEALSYYDKSMDIDPNFSPTLVNKALLLENLGEYENARQLFDKAINLEPKNIIALLAQGVLLTEKFNLPIDALQCYDTILSLDPFNFGALHNKSGVLKSLKKFDDALLCYEKILEKNPLDETALAFKGYMFSLKGDLKNALEFYNKSLAIKPNDIPTLMNKIITLRDLQRFDDAHAVLVAVAVIDPNNPHIIFLKASVLSFQGKDDDALEFLKKSIDLNPKYKQLAKSQMPENLKKDPRFQEITN